LITEVEKKEEYCYEKRGTVTKKADGTEILANRLERPFIYVEEGVTKVMTLAVLEKNGNSFSLFIPLD
jgi:hypothetical protein